MLRAPRRSADQRKEGGARGIERAAYDNTPAAVVQSIDSTSLLTFPTVSRRNGQLRQVDSRVSNVG
jgi:hypothetical protein